MKLQGKLYTLYVLISTVPILALGVYLTLQLNQYSVDHSTTIYSHNLTQISSNITSRLEGYSRIAADLARSPEIARYLTMEDQTDLAYYNYYVNYIAPLVQRATYYENDLQIKIYSPNRNLRFSGHFEQNPALFKEQLDSRAGRTGLQLSGIRVGANGRRLLCQSIDVVDYSHRPPQIGILEIGIDTDRLQRFFDGETAAGNQAFILDEKGQLLLYNAGFEEELTIFSKMHYRNGDNLRWNGQDVLYLEQSIDSSENGISGWRICMLVPLTAVNRNTVNIWRTSLQLVALCLALSFLTLTGFAQHITRRIGQLVEWMQEAGEGNASSREKLLRGNDEIAALSRQFGRMLEQLHRLTKEIIAVQIKEEQIISAQNEANLLALQYQINPHYLFNTLESIRMNLVIRKDAETAEVIRLFADGFRHMIEDTEAIVTIAGELEFVRKYFLVQQYRYDNLFTLAVDIDPTLMNCLVPKLLLQLLVENALYHGLEPLGEQGSVSITVNRRGADACCILVEDDGIGMSEQTLSNLLSALSDEHIAGRKYLALRNVTRRLTLLYGSAGSLHIDSTENKGTRVMVVLPVGKTESRGNDDAARTDC